MGLEAHCYQTKRVYDDGAGAREWHEMWLWAGRWGPIDYPDVEGIALRAPGWARFLDGRLYFYVRPRIDGDTYESGSVEVPTDRIGMFSDQDNTDDRILAWDATDWRGNSPPTSVPYRLKPHSPLNSAMMEVLWRTVNKLRIVYWYARPHYGEPVTMWDRRWYLSGCSGAGVTRAAAEAACEADVESSLAKLGFYYAWVTAFVRFDTDVFGSPSYHAYALYQPCHHLKAPGIGDILSSVLQVYAGRLEVSLTLGMASPTSFTASGHIGVGTDEPTAADVAAADCGDWHHAVQQIDEDDEGASVHMPLQDAEGPFPTTGMPDTTDDVYMSLFRDVEFDETSYPANWGDEDPETQSFLSGYAQSPRLGLGLDMDFEHLDVSVN